MCVQATRQSSHLLLLRAIGYLQLKDLFVQHVHMLGVLQECPNWLLKSFGAQGPDELLGSQQGRELGHRAGPGLCVITDIPHIASH